MIIVHHAPIRQKTPAKIYPFRKTIVIDPQRFYKIPSYNIRVFILAHELAHLFCKKEEDADWKGFEIYYRLGYPVRDAIFAITRLLSPTKAHKRIVSLLKRYDKCR